MSSLGPSLRAARTLLGMSQVDVVTLTKIKRNVISRIEEGRFTLVPREALKLQNEFEKKGIEFVEATSTSGAGVRWKRPGRFDPFRSDQFRAARGILGLSQRELAAASGINKNFIARLEKDAPKSISIETIQKLIDYLDKRGVELTSESEIFGAGVRFKSAEQNAVKTGHSAKS